MLAWHVSPLEYIECTNISLASSPSFKEGGWRPLSMSFLASHKTWMQPSTDSKEMIRSLHSFGMERLDFMRQLVWVQSRRESFALFTVSCQGSIGDIVVFDQSMDLLKKGHPFIVKDLSCCSSYRIMKLIKLTRVRVGLGRSYTDLLHVNSGLDFSTIVIWYWFERIVHMFKKGCCAHQNHVGQFKKNTSITMHLSITMNSMPH